MNIIDKGVIVGLVKKGVSIIAIAKQFNTSRYFIYRCLEEYGIDRKSIIPQPKKLVKKEVVVKLIREGIDIIDIAKRLGVNRSVIYSCFKDWGIDRKSITFNENFFKKINSEETAYWLGYLMANGCVSMTHNPKVTAVAAERDMEHLLLWHKAINSSVKLHHRNDGAYQSQHYSKKNVSRFN